MKKGLFVAALVVFFTFSSTLLAFASQPFLTKTDTGKGKLKLPFTQKTTMQQFKAKKEKAFKGNIKVNGNVIKFDVSPLNKGGRILIPLRAVSASLGAQVGYDAKTSTVTVSRDGKKVEIILVKQVIIKVDGKVYEDLDIPPEVLGNRTFVPLRFLAEVLGLKVDYRDGDVIIDEEAKPVDFSWYDFEREEFSSREREVEGDWHRDKYFSDMDFAVIINKDKAEAIDRKPLPIPGFDYDDDLLLWAYLGEAPTGGYDIKITGIYQLKDKVWARVQTISPEKGQIVTQAITHPTDTVKIEKDDFHSTGRLTFIFVDQNDQVLKEVKATVE
ncbi:stalk domain-containing protein [Zhaonella formicivorans]|uniref:stalk domain-containing protein n=1 Tax=Zhaonella formicivorans TaxID=2528593 RepID=UPI0010E67B07|nr:stalk domain-containing protein [Zhaonella formicivorans]